MTLVKDASLEAMEKAVNDFFARLKGADTGQFYYAGHGVAIDGMNYLIPVSPRIDDAASVRSKAVSVDAVVGRMEATGVRTALVFLDSCRDNPFPGASRSGMRGLAVVATPKTVNSMIAYATSPGDVAQDGTGRNGVFSGAVVRQLRNPGLELAQMMKNVKAEVSAVTGNRQNPRVDDGMKENFFFVSPEDLAARADAALATSKAELAELECQLSERQAKIRSTQDASARQALEVEQQRQQALQAAKKLEADNLAREARRQAELVTLRSNAESQRVKQTASIRKQYDETLVTPQTKVWTLRGSAAALAGEIDWGITRDAARNRYRVDALAVRVLDLTTGAMVVESRMRRPRSGSTTGRRATRPFR
ncbi:MAG: caspase family protein [Spirochaetes bacterium]|nr:caspase family protein [Spirochaetota bacterium]